VTVTERHHIDGNEEILRLCKLSKDLYNKCNYIMRQCFFKKEKLPDITFLYNFAKDLDSFKSFHNTKVPMQTIRKLINDWSNYKKSINAYQKYPNKFIKEPNPPSYKKKLCQVIFHNATIKNGQSKDIEKCFSGTIVPNNKCFEINSNRHYQQVIITPKSFGFMIDVMYEKEKTVIHKPNNNFCCVDLGVNNLCTITSDKHIPIIINGRVVKSFNRYYNKSNKNKHHTKKRYFRLENYFHHTSKFIIDNCLKNNITTIIIGKNDGWKKDIKMDKKHRQNFFYIPFDNLLEKIKYKAELSGIKVIFTEESYTSQASFLDRDNIPVYDKKNTENYQFSGQRIKRGLYKSKDGILINADVNGSANIGRKVIPDSTFGAEWDRSVGATPIIINPLRSIAAQHKQARRLPKKNHRLRIEI